MNYEAFKIWIDVAHIGVTLGIAVWLWLSQRSDKTDTRLDDHDTRLTAVETKVEAGPNHDDLGSIHDRITEVARLQERVAGEFQGVKNVLNLIHQHLLTQGAKP